MYSRSRLNGLPLFSVDEDNWGMGITRGVVSHDDIDDKTLALDRTIVDYI